MLRVWGLGCRVWVSGLGFRLQGLEYRVSLRVSDLPGPPEVPFNRAHMVLDRGYLEYIGGQLYQEGPHILLQGLRSQNHYKDSLLGPNSIIMMVVHMDLLK